MHALNTVIGGILDSLPSPAILIDEDLRIAAANQLYRSTYAQGQKVRARHCYEASHGLSAPCDRQGVSCPVTLCRETGKAASAVHLHTTSEGAEYTHVETRSVRDAEQGHQWFVVVLRPLEIGETDSSSDRLTTGTDEILPLDEVERCYLGWAVDHFVGDNRSLAKNLGLSERTFYRKLQRLRNFRQAPRKPRPGR